MSDDINREFWLIVTREFPPAHEHMLDVLSELYLKEEGHAAL